jgi:hypothetical protein
MLPSAGDRKFWGGRGWIHTDGSLPWRTARAKVASAEARAHKAEDIADAAEQDATANHEWLTRLRNGLEQLLCASA